MIENTDLFDKTISLSNKTVLSVGNNQQVVNFLKSKRLEKLYLFPGIEKIDKIDNIEIFNINECDKIINKLDTIFIDLDCNNIKEFKTLKCIMEVLVKQSLNPKLDLIVLKNKELKASDKTLYQDLIVRIWEGVIRFKNINNRIMPKFRYINLNSKSGSTLVQ